MTQKKIFALLALLALGHYCLLGKEADRRKKIEPRQERVVGIGRDQHAVCELNYAREHEEE